MFKLSYKQLVVFFLFAIPNTLLSLCILFIINQVISKHGLLFSDYLWFKYLILVCSSYLINVSFQSRVIKYSNQLIFNNELRIFDAVLKSNIERLEKLGTERIYGIIDDLRLFVFLPNVVTSSINSFLLLFICLVYLLTVSLGAAVIVLCLIAAIAFGYFLIVKHIGVRVKILKDLNDFYYKLVDDLIKGFKELKTSPIRSHNLFEKFLKPNRKEAKTLESKISNNVLAVSLLSQYGLYIIIGVIIFLLPAIGALSKERIITFVIILLFMGGPLNNLISMQSFFAKFSVAGKRIDSFFFDLAQVKDTGLNQDKSMALSSDFDSLTFNNITFQYKSQVENLFLLGPINLSIKKGEVIFIVGGNGSGKSTFINILTGLRKPSGGDIYLNGKSIENDDPVYLSQLSAIFSDNHLFSANYEDYTLNENNQYLSLLKTMELEAVVLDSRELSARRRFSKGQSKRMSLIFALLEQHPLLILDEWAADQDPYFRRYFYERLVPYLKGQGKTIIAVTHDDVYFKCADRIIKFDYGVIDRDVAVMQNENDVASLWKI